MFASRSPLNLFGGNVGTGDPTFELTAGIDTDQEYSLTVQVLSAGGYLYLGGDASGASNGYSLNVGVLPQVYNFGPIKGDKVYVTLQNNKNASIEVLAISA